MKTKTFEVEVVHTCTVKVILPETYSGDEFIREWESGLWELENGTASVAEYAARMAILHPGCTHDGVFKMIENDWQKPDYEANKYQVIAITTSDDVDYEITSEGEWEESP